MATGRTTSLTLLQRARARDENAWQRLIELYKPLVYYWCGHWGVRGADADDIQQDVFQAVAAGLAGFSHDRAGDTFRGWLKGITRHKLLDFLEKEGRRPVAAGGTDAFRHLQEVPSPDTALPDAPAAELLRLYHRALQLLHTEFEPKTWQAFWKAAVEGIPVADIAAAAGMTQAAVRKAKSRVLRRLREELGDILDKPFEPAHTSPSS
jgi:RNA polymerase sigma-70 factor, ECF subfamily